MQKKLKKEEVVMGRVPVGEARTRRLDVYVHPAAYEMLVRLWKANNRIREGRGMKELSLSRFTNEGTEQWIRKGTDILEQVLVRQEKERNREILEEKEKMEKREWNGI